MREPEREVTPAAPSDPIAELSARVDRMAASFETFRERFEAEQVARQRFSAEESRLREARLLEQLSRSLARASGELLEAPATHPLRPPRVPADWNERPTTSPTSRLCPDAGPLLGPAVRGTLDGMNLSTVLGMFELERRDGVFRLAAPEGSVELDLRRGAIVRGRIDGHDSEVVATLTRAFEFGSADFRFTEVPVTADSDAPLSLNGLLLEVFHRQDEARRAG